METINETLIRCLQNETWMAGNYTCPPALASSGLQWYDWVGISLAVLILIIFLAIWITKGLQQDLEAK